MPIDYLAYHQAAEALQHGESPYLSPEQSLEIWRYFHRSAVEVITAQKTEGRGQEMLRELVDRPQQPGPYLYPPTLARLIAFFNVTPLIFAVMLLISILGFSWLWIRSTHAHSIWLLFVVLSLDVLASLNGGNVELLLLFAALLAAWLLWRGYALRAAPLLAVVALIKPFYALFFVAFGLIQWASRAGSRRSTVRTWATAGTGAAALIALDVYSWGPTLRDRAFYFFQHAWEYQWFSLPAAEQTPMSHWNRTPLQAFVSAEIPASTAQILALGLWVIFTGVTVWYARGKELPFSLSFALALILLYWGRPVGWTLVYLEFIVVVSVWSLLSRHWQWLLLAAAAALLLSHWAAFVRTALGYDMSLLTLQTAHLPWETFLALPLSWLLLLYAVAKTERNCINRRTQCADERHHRDAE